MRAPVPSAGGRRLALAVRHQRFTGLPGREAQPAVLVQHRQAVADGARQAQLPDVQRDLAVHRPVAGGMAGLRRERQRQQARGEGVGGGDALGCGQGAAALAHHAPQRVAFAAHREVRGKAMRAIVAAPASPREVHRRACRPAMRANAGRKYVLRHADACETTLNPGFKWGRLEPFGLPATWRTCTPGFRCVPVVVVKGQGECCACRRTGQRTRRQYSRAPIPAKPVRRHGRCRGSSCRDRIIMITEPDRRSWQPSRSGVRRDDGSGTGGVVVI